ncbi:hypothetical protein NVP2117O_04 [Vibrio phage 2.117.O._10N.261.45.E9]|nr:hypothetical protein NVP1117O_04 [Vibrio phage 1.117.O._10N.261.45.E9]AUR95486.1 hypothetical protein NVP1207B_79 [Vibrio phage 1.207.B._10N.222.51.C2]AUS02296.1 hypothetical protein NVP2117O_04 [Vibrio phage 2.117.O._10N.261.45.E9]
MTEETKLRQCRSKHGCGKFLPQTIEHFYRTTSHGCLIWSSACRACTKKRQRAYGKAWREKNPEYNREYLKRYHKETKGVCDAQL